MAAPAVIDVGAGDAIDRRVGTIIETGFSTPTAEIAVDVGPLRVRVTFATTSLDEAFAESFARQAPTSLGRDLVDWSLHVAAGRGTAPDLGSIERRGEMQLSANGGAYLLWMGRHAPTLYAVDVPNRRALYWTETESLIPAWERSRPFLPIFQVMLDATPWVAIHAAALARNGRAVMFTGPGRSGKTSLALAGLRAGWGYVGDDYILLRTDAEPAVAPLYATARLRDDMLPRFETLLAARREISEDDGDRRHEMSLRNLDGVAAIRETPLSAVLMLARHGSPEPTFGPSGRAAVLSTLVANMAVATPGHAPERTAKLFRLLAGFAPQAFDPGVAFGPALDAMARMLV